MESFGKVICDRDVDKPAMITLTDSARSAWRTFFRNTENHGHVSRELINSNIDEHVNVCFASSTATVERIKRDLPEIFHPNTILEVGSSAGLNCFALQAAFPSARVIGLEPELAAVNAAKSMLETYNKNESPVFIEGFGEKIPLEAGSVDLIICHTVIEHVQNVPAVVSEMARVLNNNGIIHLEAPNYLYPYEPHLEIHTIPLFGKWFVKITAFIQGKRQQISFVNHLQFVTPRNLERLFKHNNLKWKNRITQKLRCAIVGDAEIKKYKFAAKTLGVLNKMGIANIVINVISSIGFYPSLMYTLYKSDFSE